MDPYRFTPSERTATTIEEFLEVCRAEPTLAADQLHQGYFEPWLRDAGRPDLAEAAAQVRQTNVAPAAALEQFLQAATLARPRRRRMRALAGARAAGRGLPTQEEPRMDAAPTEEANTPQVAEPPTVTRLASEEARRVFPSRRKLSDEQAREVTRLYAETDMPVEAIARQFSIGQASVYRRLAQQQGVPVRKATAASAPSRARTSVGAESDGGRAPGTSPAIQRTPRRRRTTAGPSTAMAEFGDQSRSGGVGRQFRVTFLAETVIEAADIRHVIRQIEALGATDITAITRQG